MNAFVPLLNDSTLGLTDTSVCGGGLDLWRWGQDLLQSPPCLGLAA